MVAPDSDAATLAALDDLLVAIHGKVPATVEARVQRVAGTVRKTLPRLDQLGGSSEQAHAVRAYRHELHPRGGRRLPAPAP